MENNKDIKVNSFTNANNQKVIQIITPDKNHWYYIEGQWILHN